MADPRKTTAFSRIGALDETFAIDNSTITYDVTKVNGSASVGLAVTLSAANTVALAADGEFVLGKLLKVEADNMALVQVKGEVELPGGNGATLTRGKAIVGALNASAAKGYIREVATATAAELGRQRGYIHSAADTAAVQVML
jgi:hypothetical protein